MKKEYTNPTIEIIELNKEDVIVTSTFGANLYGDNSVDYGSFFQE